MTAGEKKRELALYRLKQANEAVDEAQYLLDGGKSARAVINRAYYAMFYAVMALLVFEEFSSSKHSGVLAFFNQRFIKEGRLPKEMGQAVNVAFELRQRADYKEYSDLTAGQVSPFANKARAFIAAVEAFLRERGLI